MRRYIEIATNVAVICTCAVVIYVFLGPQKTRQPPERPKAIAKGERLTAPGDLRLDRAEQTLLMVIQSNCKYCTASMPFYNRLATRVLAQNARAKLQLVVLTRDERTTSDEYLRAHGLVVQDTVRFTPELAKTLRVPGTPALILANSSGTVESVWFGQLDNDKEHQVEQALFEPGTPF